MRRWLLAALMAASVPFAMSARAQDGGTEVTIPERPALTFPLDAAQPLIVYADQVNQGRDEAFVVPIIFVQLPDGDFTRMTPCDDIAIPCQAFYVRAAGPMANGTQGDSYILKRFEGGAD
jgi:hypothetical protein